jgi:hypothetical protein
MIPVHPHAAATAELSIDRLRQTNSEALHPPREGRSLVGLDEQVHMIRLDREVHDPKPEGRCGGERASDDWEHVPASKRWESGNSPQRDVYGMPAIVKRTSAMRYAGLGPARLSARAGTGTTSPTEAENGLATSSHL